MSRWRRNSHGVGKTVSIEMGTCHEILSCVPRLTGWFFQRLVYVPLRRSGAPHSLRQAQGYGFPHTQVAKPGTRPEGVGLSGAERARRKEPRPSASHSRNDFMAVPLRRMIGGGPQSDAPSIPIPWCRLGRCFEPASSVSKKEHPYPLGQRTS